MLSFKVLIEFTSKTSPSLSLFIISLAGVFLLVVASYKQYRSNNFDINGESILSKKEKKEQEEINNELNILKEEDEKFKESIGYIKNSIIIGTHSAGVLFQLIKTNDGFLFHYVGNMLKGVDKSKVITDFSNIEINKDNKKDYILKFEEIEKITANIKNNFAIMDYGNLKITLKNGKSKKYGLINLFEEKELKLFFNNNIEIKNKVNNINNNENVIDEIDKNKLNKLNKFFFIFSIISSVVFGLYFMFLKNNIAHAILTTFCIIICLLPFILYIAFPKHVSLKEKYRYDSSVQQGKLNIVEDIFLYPILFIIISLIDGYKFIYYDFVKLLIYSVVLFVILISIFLACTKEYRKQKSALVIIIFVCLFLSPAIVHKVNTAYDFTPSQEISCQITDKPTWTNKKNEITYYITFNYKNKNIKTEVAKEVYEKYNIQDNIVIIKKQGLLGIERLILNE